jgi:hypothetical protein
MAPKLFNFYLNIAQQSSPIVKKKIENNALFAYAYDLIITFKEKNEF